MMQAPPGSPRNMELADRAEPALFVPDIAKRTSAPKGLPHMRTFSFFKVGFKRGIVRVSFAFYLDVAFDGGALCAVQPHLARLSLVIVAFPEETPVVSPIALIVFLSEPGRGLLRMPSPCPPPQTVEDRMINV